MLWAATGQRLRGIAWVLVGGSVVFAGIAMGRAFGTAGPDALTLPLALLASAGVIAAALLTGWYPVRPIAQGLAVFGALVHLLVLLRSGPVWTRGCSAVLAVTHVYALVMLFVLSAREADDDTETPRVDDPSTPSRQSQHTESAVSAPTPAVPDSAVVPDPDAVAEQPLAPGGGSASGDESAPESEAAPEGEVAPESEVAPEGEVAAVREPAPDGAVASDGEAVPDPQSEPEPAAESSTEEREPVESAVGGPAEQRPASTEENR